MTSDDHLRAFLFSDLLRHRITKCFSNLYFVVKVFAREFHYTFIYSLSCSVVVRTYIPKYLF